MICWIVAGFAGTVVLAVLADKLLVVAVLVRYNGCRGLTAEIVCGYTGGTLSFFFFNRQQHMVHRIINC